MSSCVLYRSEDYVIVQNGHGKNLYYTAVNTKLNTHVHVNGGIKTAKIVVQRAKNNNLEGLNEYKLHRVLILQGKDKNWNDTHRNVRLHF